MNQIFKMAIRNLMRYKRRTLLTAMLITMGILMVILFSGLAGSFTKMMIGHITDSNLAQMQIHKKGYISSIDSMPLNLNLSQTEYNTIEKILQNNPEVEAYAPRIKFSAMLSNYAETTNIRLNAVDPEKETMVCPDVENRMVFKDNVRKKIFVKPGEIIIPKNMAKGMNIKVGGPVVIVAQNRDGSINGLNFIVAAIIESVLGPQGKEGYIHINDARTLLRMEKSEVTEIAVRIKKFDKLNPVYAELKSSLLKFKNKKAGPIFEIHTWEKLSPFVNIAKMINLMTISMKLIMIIIVLISILNIMMMSVYERVSEIGTMIALGTSPGKIMVLFISEGFFLGLISAVAGNVIGIAGLYLLNIFKIRFSFSRMDNLLLSPAININELFWLTAIVLLVSVFATLQPAYKASKMEPVDALRHV